MLDMMLFRRPSTSLGSTFCTAGFYCYGAYCCYWFIMSYCWTRCCMAAAIYCCIILGWPIGLVIMAGLAIMGLVIMAGLGAIICYGIMPAGLVAICGGTPIYGCI